MGNFAAQCHCWLLLITAVTSVHLKLFHFSMAIVKSFYRATLCVSAVLAVGRCPSVRYVRVLYPDIVKLLSRPGMGPSLKFLDPKHQYPIARGTLLAGHKIHGVEKIRDFRLNSPFTQKRYEIGPWLQ